MSGRLRLGRIWTVPIQGTYSMLVLIALVAGLAAWQFSVMVDGYGLAAYAGAGLFSALLFLWTVFAHEAAHVAAARHFGARVKGVTLSALGGETAISGEPGSPWQGIAVATSGPGVSALCGVVCLAGGIVLERVGTPVLIAACFAWVGILCLVLAVVNLIPAAPLDGGHVLQSLLWATTGNRTRASAISGYAGQLVGAVTLAAAGWLAVRGAGPLTVIGIALMAWPLWRGASAVRRCAKQRILLAGVRAADLLPPRPVVLAQDDTVASALRRLGDRTKGYVAVVDDAARPVAAVRITRLQRAAQRGVDPLARLIRRRPDIATATPDEPLADALERTHAQPKPIAVVDDGRFVGLLDPDDIRAAIRDARPGPVPAGLRSGDEWPGARH